MRLKHNEINKVATGFCSEYDSKDGYHIINLDFSDHVSFTLFKSVIDAYDGIYEMSILISDPGMDNPILWNFGKIEMKFSKPLDPTNSEESNKNPQKPKIEHVFQPENKNKRTF